MELNKEGREKLRNEIEKELLSLSKKVPITKQKVHIDKELLEQLLFETVVYDEKTKASVKLPCWSGRHLSAIDLSEIDFSNVSWALLSEYGPILAMENHFDCEAFEMITVNQQGVIYSNTNANIDFSKSWEATSTNNKKAIIVRCCFSNTDLSQNDISVFRSISNCDLSNTHLRASNADDLIRTSVDRTDFNGLDFHSLTIHFAEDCRIDDNCEFKNTGLNIIVGEPELSYLKSNPSRKRALSRMIRRGWLDGCYINGKLIHSQEERKEMAQKKKEDYEKMQDDLIDSTIASIRKQAKVLCK